MDIPSEGLPKTRNVTLRNIKNRDETFSEMRFLLKNQKNLIISYRDCYKKVFKSHGQNDSFWDNGTKIEILENEEVIETTIVDINCQAAAWGDFQKTLEHQNYIIKSLVFRFEVSHNPCNLNFPPNFPENTLSCRSLRITGKRNFWLTFQILHFVKPIIENLHIDQISYPYHLSIAFGKLDEVRKAKRLWSTIAMEKEQVLELNGADISIDPLYLNQCFVKDIMKKSIETGNPRKFHVFRGGKNPEGVLKHFNFSPWTFEISKTFEFEYQLVPGCKYYLVELPTRSFSLFVEFFNGRQDVAGFILKKLS